MRACGSVFCDSSQLTERNARRNDVPPEQLTSLRLCWGDESDVQGVLAALSNGPELIVASDVLYEWGPEDAIKLEATVSHADPTAHSLPPYLTAHPLPRHAHP